MAESESNRWRLASLKRKGALPSLRRAATEAEERSSKRQEALREIYSRCKIIEGHLNDCKNEAQKRWEEVAQAEEQVTKLLEQKLIERSQKREKEHMEQLQAEGSVENLNSEMLFDIVSAVNESIEAGSFEPLSMSPPPPPTNNNNNQQTTSEATAVDPPTSTTDSIDEPAPTVSRAEIEEQVGLPQLTAAAIAADNMVHAASGSLLNVLSSLDQLRRSARISSETCLLSACNAQAGCLKSLIKLEREAAEERLKQIKHLETLAEEIDVRHDLDAYITADRKRQGGSAALGDDDDGGIASALAVLTSHADGDVSVSSAGLDMDDSEGSALDMSSDEVEEIVEKIFSKKGVEKGKEQFDASIQALCDVLAQKSTTGRARRSQICMLFNSRRSDSQISTQVQFDALCKVILNILNGCDCESGAAVSNAKVCMMLSQTFFFSEDAESCDVRSNRIYVKSRLHDHPLWKSEEFW